jgi:dihydrofolate reductase
MEQRAAWTATSRGPSGAVDWLVWSKDVTRVNSAYLSRVDTILMGRKTYEIGRTHGSVATPGYTTYVFSRTLERVPEPGVELIRGDAAAFVADLRAGAGKEICLMGGGELAATLFAADLIDQVGVNIHPLLLGKASRCFAPCVG